jgi:hypothetical protein
MRMQESLGVPVHKFLEQVKDKDKESWYFSLLLENNFISTQ